MIRLTLAQLAALAKAAETAWPREACALLEGVWDGGTARVNAVHFADNVAVEPERRFEVDPRVLARVHRELRGRPGELVGVWHSHPDGSASLSETDRRSIYEPGLIWLLTPAPEGRAVGPHAFRTAGEGDGVRFEAVPVEPTPEP